MKSQRIVCSGSRRCGCDHLDSASRSRAGGTSPALVLSPAAYNGRVGLALLCPITGLAKGYPFEVGVPDGLAVTGAVLADHVKCLDWRARKPPESARSQRSRRPSH